MAGMSVPDLEARMSMVDGFPYKEEVGGSSPSVPTIYECCYGRQSYRATGHDKDIHLSRKRLGFYAES